MHETDDLDDGYMGSGKLLKRAINKHGINNFKKEILFLFDNENDMKNKEAEVVIPQHLNEMSYNLCDGGKGGWSYINRTRKNIYGKNGQIGYGQENLHIARIKHIERLRTDNEYKLKYGEKISNLKKIYYETHEGTFLNKKHSEETKKKMRGHTRQIGTKNSQYGKPRSEETKQKIRKSINQSNKIKLPKMTKTKSPTRQELYIKSEMKARELFEMFRNLKCTSVGDFIKKGHYSKSKVALTKFWKKYIPEYRENVVQGKPFRV